MWTPSSAERAAQAPLERSAATPASLVATVLPATVALREMLEAWGLGEPQRGRRAAVEAAVEDPLAAERLGRPAELAAWGERARAAAVRVERPAAAAVPALVARAGRVTPARGRAVLARRPGAAEGRAEAPAAPEGPAVLAVVRRPNRPWARPARLALFCSAFTACAPASATGRGIAGLARQLCLPKTRSVRPCR